MGEIALNAGLFLGALFLMEGVAYFAHRYVMHGFMWFLHKSHHQRDTSSMFEWNDLFAVIFSLPSIGLIYVGLHIWEPMFWIGMGVAAYGLIYFLFHDVVVHQRIRFRAIPEWPFLKRIIEAHLIHHHVVEKKGAVSFGFLYAPPIDELKATLAENKRKGLVSDD